MAQARSATDRYGLDGRAKRRRQPWRRIPDLSHTGIAAAVVFIAYVLSPNATPFDSRWTVHTTHSIIHEADTDLNEFRPALERDAFYAIECVSPNHERIYPVTSTSQCPDGRYYNFYPVAVPLLATPAILVMEQALRAVQPLTAQWSRTASTEARRALLRADVLIASMAAIVE